MKNIHFTRTVTTEQTETDPLNCKVKKTVIEVHSERFSNDLNYQNSINECLQKSTVLKYS